MFAQRVNSNQTRIDRTLESSEFGYQTDLTLGNWLERVGTADAAWDSSQATNALTQSMDCILSRRSKQTASGEQKNGTTYSRKRTSYALPGCRHHAGSVGHNLAANHQGVLAERSRVRVCGRCALARFAPVPFR
jgi:hypothetical protein